MSALKTDTPFHIVVADDLYITGWELLNAAHDVHIIGPFNCRDDLYGAISEADALLICSDTSVDAELIAAAPKLKVIARAGARLDNVDIDEATRCGILVIHVPAAHVTAMVEYTFLLMLALARNFDGPLDKRNLGFQLSGKTLGIVGFGRQGREVATRAQSFGMSVLAYDPYMDLSFARQHSVEIVDLPELLARADLLTLHTAYTQKTHQMLNAEAFAQIKPGSYLLNCIHPNLIDETALLAALDDGTLAGAALDIWDLPAIRNSRMLRQHPFQGLTEGNFLSI